MADALEDAARRACESEVMNRHDLFHRMGLGMMATSLAVLAPKLLPTTEVANQNTVNGAPAALVSETLEEVLESGETIAIDMPQWTEQVTSQWQRIPTETLRRMSDGAVKSFTWIYRYSDGSTTKWTEFLKIHK
jgi:hypothetical protein